MDPLVSIFSEETQESDEKKKSDSLPPEVEEGNIEYKLKLINPSASRFEHLVTQMKWRLREGQGEAIYEIGVADNGSLLGLSTSELRMSLETVTRMAHKLGATGSVLRKRDISEPDSNERLWVAEVMIRKVPDDQQFLDVRVAVLGNMEAGKSTLLGVLTQGELDNGRGKARLNLFRHLHEIQSGHTSSISLEIMGFTPLGEVVNYATHSDVEDICEASAKLITLIDLAGHQKYLKTTVFGLSSCRPDFVLLVVGANSGVVGTTCEHLGFCVALKVPMAVVISKIDLCSKEKVEQVIKKLETLLTNPGCNRVPRRIVTENDVYVTAHNFKESNICPIFFISNVTGKNLELLTRFFNAVPKYRLSDELERQEAEFQIDEIYSVPEVGVVLGGTLTRGTMRNGDEVQVGPTEDCSFFKTKIMSMHRHRSPCRLIKAGQAATLALYGIDRSLMRKGMVVLDIGETSRAHALCSWKLVADVFLIHHTGSGIKKGYQTTLYVSAMMQTVTVEQVEAEEETLRQSQRGRIHFKFQRHPAFLRVGWRLLFRDGQSRGMGEIVQITKGSIKPKRDPSPKRTPSPSRE